MGTRAKWLAITACIVAAVCGAAFGIKSLVSNNRDTGSTAVMQAFAKDWARQDAAAAAAHTTAPGQAEESLTASLRAMGAQRIDVSVERPVEYTDGSASFSLRTTWNWSDDRSYTSETSGTARHLSTGWRVAWEPTLINSDLPSGGKLRLVRTDARPAPKVLSRSGKTFMYLQPVSEVVLDPTRSGDTGAAARSLAKVLAPIAPLVTADVINQKIAATPGRPITAVTLRDSDMAVLTRRPESVRGVTVQKSSMLVLADRRLGSPLEAGLTNYWQAIRDATAGWQVQLVGPGIATPRRLAGEQGPPGPNVATTVDQGVQLTLGDAAVMVAQPATILVLDAATGGIEGMAQNDAAAARGINIDTPYLVGSTLDPVLEAADRTGSRGVALDRLGLGVGFTIPGASAPAPGQPGVATIDYERSGLKMSMSNMAAFGVAMARSMLGSPSSVAPFIINGATTRVEHGELGDLDPAVARSVAAAMTTTARTGDASDLTNAQGLKALVGTNGPQGPGWFVGVQDGKVIVIYTEGATSGTAALQVAQKYFRIR
ncbi:MAG: NTF2-like N-terminal transpeptidase domain-containing protein [Gordonia sp. (in: high G+C Gram-positive bacteria)]